MTYKFTILLLLCLLGTISKSQAQDRDVLFAHGQGGRGPDTTGAGGTWEVYDDIFSGERQMNSIRENWQERNGLQNYGNAMSNTLANQSTTPPNAPLEDLPLGIGHSNGGLGLRTMMQVAPNTDRILGGVVTVGTPHNGAAIVNNIQNGSVQSSLNRGCRALAAGPSTWIGGGFAVNGITAAAFCAALPTLLELIFDNEGVEGQVVSQSAQEAAVGSDFFTTINEFQPNVNIISVYGNEESPVHWRLLSSQNSDNVSDTRWVNFANVAIAVYSGLSVTYGVLGSVRVITGIFTFNPVAFAKGGYNIYQSVQWARGAQWIANSEQYWLDDIDCESSSTFTQPYTVTVLPCTNFMTGTAEWLQCMEENNCLDAGGIAGCAYQVTGTRTVTVNAASDGFICVDSQIYDPFDNGRNYEAEGVNHSDEVNTTFMQTLNSNDEIYDTFEEIFDRPDEFAIPRI